MQELTYMEQSDLYDLLAQQTNRYMKMLSGGATRQEFDQCREGIMSIQAEIRSRKNQKEPGRSNSTISSSPPFSNRQKN